MHISFESNLQLRPTTVDVNQSRQSCAALLISIQGTKTAARGKKAVDHVSKVKQNYWVV